ncbi:MAG: c-type cytochrome [Methyloceanibacter sp.]|uniref:c-type cytochrome n=1 Tax=Methyloceanibacter sp. TaxID=1965321 RepID=UPI003D6CC2B2
MLRVLTIILLVIGITFVAWSLLVMTGGRDWLAATMTADTTVADAAPPKAEAPTAEAPTAPDEAKPDAEESVEASQGTEENQAAGEDSTAEPPKDESAAAGEPAGEGKDETAGSEKPADEATDKPDGEAASVDPAGNPLETAKAAEKGSLKSPYAGDYASVAEDGHKKYMAAGCNGCHGGGGGGGMGPPLTNPVWVYGNDGDTLFRLIALGTVDFQKQGYTRKGSENVVGPMPPMGGIVKSNDDMWKIIAWIWSVNPPKAAAAQ